MKIAIVAQMGEGKTTFVDTVLVPALLAMDGRGFSVHEHGVLTIRVAGPTPVRVATFHTPEEAADWLKTP